MKARFNKSVKSSGSLVYNFKLIISGNLFAANSATAFPPCPSKIANNVHVGSFPNSMT